MKIPSMDEIISIAIFFLMLGAIILPFWGNALSGANFSAIGVTATTFGAILLVLFIVWIVKGKGK